MRIRVYEYGCGRGQIEGLEPAVDQMRRRTEFWNRLVEIDNDVRVRMDALLFAGEHESELNSLRENLRGLLRSGISGLTDREGARDDQKSLQINALRAAVRSKLDEVKRIRKENAARHRAELRELDGERKRRIAKLHAEPGLYWANRDEIRRKYEVARAQAIRAGRQLRPQRWDETGRIHLHFQRGLAVPDAFSRNGRLQIDPVPDTAWQSPSRSERRHLARTRIRIRVIANEDRSPVWLDVPIILHRPLPEKGAIRSVSFVRERVALNWRHRVLLTVTEPTPSNPTISEKAVGVDLGWRLTPEGLRVAYWAGEDGCSGELLLPNTDLTEFKKIGSLQAAIINAHEQAISHLRAFFNRDTMLEELRQTAAEALRSSSPRTLGQFLERWQTCRFTGDRRAFTALRAWHKQHIHLWTWQANLRDQLLRRRRELYRRFASDLSGRYGQVFVNDIQLQRLTVRPMAVDEFIPIQRHHRFIVAISVLYRVLQNACEKRGVLLNRLKCKGATVSCHFCGTIDDDWNPKTALTHTCSQCGETWDQDHNAAVLVLRQGLALPPSVQVDKS